MKAVLIKEFGSVDNLYIGNAEKPRAKAGEVLVEIKATALNRADIAQRTGVYPAMPGESEILGLEMAGKVVALGTDVESVNIGDRVCALLPGGGYAQYVNVPVGLLMKIPDNVTYEQAAAIPEAFLTVYQSLFSLGQLTKGKTVLLHAGASGIGTTAIQMIKLVGASVLVTAGSNEKVAKCIELGAKAGWNYKNGPFLPFVQGQTDGKGVDVVLDCIGAPYFEQNILSLVPGGKLVVIGSLGEKNVENLDLGSLLLKRFELLRTTLRSRTLKRKIELTKELTNLIEDSLKREEILPVIDTVFDWKDVKKAHQYMEENKNSGKIVLKITD